MLGVTSLAEMEIARRQRSVLEQLEERRLLAAEIGTGTGLIGNYYSDLNLSNLALARGDATVNFNFGSASPHANVPDEGFTARWTGQVQAQYTENFTFHVESAGGVRLWVNGQQLINAWTPHSLRTDTGQINLQAGKFYDLVLEFRDSGSSSVKMLWSSPSTPKALVPTSQLYRMGTNAVSGGWLSSDIDSLPGTIVGNSNDDFTIQVGQNLLDLGIRSLTLIDGKANTDIGPLVDGQTIDFQQVGQNLSVRANASPALVGSVKFELDGQLFSIDNDGPVYALRPYVNGDYYSWTPTLGQHTLTVTPYSQANAVGQAGIPYTVTFNVINGQPQIGPAIASLTLIDGKANADIGPLVNGQTINFQQVGQNLSIRANTSPSVVGSVKFELDGQVFSIDNDAPVYALRPYVNGDYYSWTPGLGSHTLKVTAYSGANATGTAGTPLTVNFTVVNSTTVIPTLAGLNLINAATDQSIGPLSSGMTIDTRLVGNQLNVQAIPAANVGSVQFLLNGVVFRTESSAPFALAGDNNGDFLPWTPSAGDYTLVAVPYTDAGATGTAGTPITVEFTVTHGPVITEPAVIGFELYEGLEPIGPLTDGQTIDFAEVGSWLNIHAGTAPAVVGSVKFELDGALFRIDSELLGYSLVPEGEGWTPALGQHTLTATAYNEANATGDSGTPLTVTFTVIDTTAPTLPSVNSLTLIDGKANADIGPLENGQTIDLQQVGLFLNVRANIGVAGHSVKFELDGQLFSIDNDDVYAMRPYVNGDYYSWTPSLGQHTLVVTPYTRANATGTAGTPYTVTFTVVNGQVAQQAVTGLTLVNGQSNSDIGPFTDGMVINLAQTRYLNIRAATSPSVVGSVQFKLDGQVFATDGDGPIYTMRPYVNGDYYSWTPTVGSHMLVVTPYTGAAGAGTAGQAITVNFTVINGTAPVQQSITGLTLIDGKANVPIGPLTSGMTINFAQTGVNLSVQAATNPGTVGSVRFVLDGQTFSTDSDGAPYTLRPYVNGDYYSWTPGVGQHTLVVTPYTGSNATGTAGTPMTVAFNVVQSLAAMAQTAAMTSTVIPVAVPLSVAQMNDQLHFTHKIVRGDVEMTARIDSTNSLAGLMIRSDTAANAPFVEVQTDGTGVTLEWRTELSGLTQVSDTSAADPGTWLRLVRDGNAFAGYVSTTGEAGTWQLVGTAGIPNMPLYGLVGMAVEDLPGTIPDVGVFSDVLIDPVVPLGAHLNLQGERIEDRPFVDLIKSTRGFTPIGGSIDVDGNGTRVATDANGWPLADFAVSVLDFTEYGTTVEAGTYKMRLNGPQNVTVAVVPGLSGITLANHVYSGGMHTYDVVVAGGVQKIALNFTNTAGAVKNLAVLQPSFSFSSAPLFHPKYIALLKDTGSNVLRTMHFTKTIGSQVANWSDRTQPTDASQELKGVAWEHVIDLANTLNQDLWINIPIRATDDYVHQLATLIKNTLKPDLNVYVEYSNEVWNTLYEQTQYNDTQAVLEVISDKQANRPSELNYDNLSVDTSKPDHTNPNAVVWGERRYARRTHQLGDIFAGVFGANALNTRVRMVLAGQFSKLAKFDNELEFLNHFYGQPRDYLWSIAVGAYAGVPNNAGMTKDQVLAHLTSSIQSWENGSATPSALNKAKQWGLRLDAYEIGIDTYGGNSIAAKRAAMLDPAVQGLMARFLNYWYARGGSQANWVTVGSRSYNSTFGTWSITENRDTLNSPKQLAYKQIRDAEQVDWIGNFYGLDGQVADTWGWTALAPSADSRVVYVDNTPGGPGSDSNNGLSPNTAVATFAKAKSLIRNGFPDWILINRGTTHNQAITNWNLSGRSASEPLVIGSYGDPAAARPKFVTGATVHGFSTELRSDQVTGGFKVRHVALVGLEFTPGTPDTTAVRREGFYTLGAVEDFLIEDCIIRGYQDNVVLEDQFSPVKDFKLRRSMILDAYGAGSSVDFSNRTQGFYAEGVDGLLLEENLFDHNGWNESDPTAGPDMHSQGIYLYATNKGVVARGNIIARSSGHGLQARSGGTVRDNVFISNPFGLAFGYVNGAPATAGGVFGSVTGNAFLGSRDVPWDDGVWAIDLGNTRPAAVDGVGGVGVRNNLFVGDTPGDKAAIQFRITGNNVNPQVDVGLNDLTFENNTVYRWSHGINVPAGLVPGGTGQFALNDLTVRNNDVQQTTLAPVVQRNIDPSAQEHWSGNRYHMSFEPVDGETEFHVGDSFYDLNGWQAAIEPTAQVVELDYVDANRSVVSYNAAMGGVADQTAFLSALRSRPSGVWNSRYAASAILDYVRDGYGLNA